MSLRLAMGLLMLGIVLSPQKSIITQATAQAFPNKVDERAVWRQQADLSPCQGLGEGRSGPCLETVMRQSGASAEAIAFAGALNFDGYLSELNRAGKVDVGTVTYPFRANTNDEPVLLNGDPPLIDVWKEAGTVNMSRNTIYAAIKRRFPDNYPGVPVFDFMRFAKGGGQVFVYSWEIKAPCRACDVVAVVRDTFEFDVEGHYLGAKLLGVERKVALAKPAPKPASPPPPPPESYEPSPPPPSPPPAVCVGPFCLR